MNQAFDSQQSWERQTLEKLLMQVYKEQKSIRRWRWIRRIFWLILLSFVVISFMMGDKVGKIKGAHTAIVNLDGVIDSSNKTTETVLQGLKDAYANKNVKGIILRANSPGGSPVVSDITFREIQLLKSEHPDIPLYVVAEDVCASGCYYIASAADKIYANHSSMMGSIGVINGGFGFTKLISDLGIERRLKTAGENKGMGDPFTPETPEQEAIWQGMLNDIHAQFIAAVKKGRGDALLWEKYPDVFSGRVYTGTEAKTMGLIDDYGSIYSVARDVFKAEEMVDYTPEDFSSRFGRRLGTEVKNGLDVLTQPSW